ncbi:cytochrome c biogenesis protein CcdA [Tissierella sp. Yu-01]|uniref:cytochrome c biogenesis CcdA family protein n=1 Tax=Tissierella sp. Yu-01 TaxID=3035694 RepID=UPI00240E0569|nr:cytochrome c biogenesis protein CcdA [Tissierella sp. Yu-01]WFA08257.1 cytochrome c biogenesis protein CcdA [Tissierella sp. Yu-01]
MFSNDVSLPLAFGAGFISFFSPCILPMIPAYIMYITGVNVEEDLASKRKLAILRTLAFVLGFTIVFIIMGSTATILGKVFVRNKDVFAKISGLIIVVFGLNMMGIINLKFLNFNKRASAPKKITNWFSSLLMGMAFAAGWTPCFGPVLASILIFAGGADTVLKGILLLLIYSIGMAIPFILTAMFINVFDKFLNKSDKILSYIPKIAGLIMVIFGLLVFFNKVINISRLLL